MFYMIDTRFGLTFSDVQRAFPNTSFVVGEDITDFAGVTPYAPVDPPAYDSITQGVREIAPQDGLQRWEITTLTPEEAQQNLDAAWANVRSERDAKLSACDWTQLPDVPITDREAWVTYRQALRDVTSQPDPRAIVWPIPPSDSDQPNAL